MSTSTPEMSDQNSNRDFFVSICDRVLPIFAKERQSRLLLIEDSQTSAEIFQQACDQLQIDMALAVNWTEASALITRFRFQYLVIDWNLPDYTPEHVVPSLLDMKTPIVIWTITPERVTPDLPIPVVSKSVPVHEWLPRFVKGELVK